MNLKFFVFCDLLHKTRKFCHSSITSTLTRWRRLPTVVINDICHFSRVSITAKSKYYLRNVCPSICPSARTTRLSLHGFSLNLITLVFFENLSWKFKFH
jgi:hypothetical protein